MCNQVQNVETGKIKSCTADRDEGGRRGVFSEHVVYPVYIRMGERMIN